jgi:biopolymer transport protein TolQ
MSVLVTTAAGAAGAVDMSFWALFIQAHIVVKLVMIGLVAASIVCWAIIFEKAFMFRRVKGQMDRFEQVFWSGQSLEDLYQSLAHRPGHGMAAVFVAAMREWKRTQEAGGRGVGGLKDRIEKVMDVTIAREAERLEARLLFLASVGSSAPFIGLFGTVWGIMTSFQAIAVSQNTNLAVVAPGIAEALFATAIGLVAAIPAVIAYNKLQADAAKHVMRMEGFADEFSAIISRQIDTRLAA